MKLFNQNKISWKTIAFLEIVFLILHFFLARIKVLFLRDKTPCLVLVDGFLVGDAVLLRPLIKGLIDRFSGTHKIILVSGNHAQHIFSDFSDKIEIISCQFPWASYDYSIGNLKKLFLNWFLLYRKAVDIAIESRGDFRSISWTYLSCPIRLIGFDFTGGSKLLTTIVPDDGNVTHLFEHVIRLGATLGCNLDTDDIQFQSKTPPDIRGPKKRIGVSFSGSQQLRNLPVTDGLNIIKCLIAETDLDICYIMSPHSDIFTSELLNKEFGVNINIFSGNFESYFNLIKSLDLYIGMDSGGGHLCSIWSIPSVIIFGTQVSWYTKPVGRYPLLCAESLSKLPCRPCDGTSCTNPKYQACLANIDITSIMAFIRRYKHTISASG